VLVKRIYDAADEAQQIYPNIEILNAPYLDDHPLVIDTFMDRIREMLVGQNLMNCAMCKYREQVLGFEAEIGLKQESHHHHVEGIGGGLENCPCNGDCDSSCRDEAFCRKHNLPWTPIHTHDHDHPHDHNHTHVLAVGTYPSPSRGRGTMRSIVGGGSPTLSTLASATNWPPPDHDHHHHPYPHSNHPLGPLTLPKIPGKLARKDRE
jgi:sirohydrochlorin cobaltochelatase